MPSLGAGIRGVVRRTLAVAHKELRQLARDRPSLAMVVGIPALQLTLFGYAINLDVRDVPTAVLDRAHSALSRKLVGERFKDRPFLFVEGFFDPQAHGISLVRTGNLVHARSSPDVSTIYDMTNLLIIPSQWEEPFGRVALEAMYNGIPVIASRTGGLTESVGEGGLLIDDFTNVESWAEAIESLDNPKERKRLIEAGREHVKQFSLDRETDKLMEILKGVAG